MARARSFMDRMMAGVGQDLIYEAASFTRMLANRLEGNRLSTRVWGWEITERFGTDVTFLRVAMAMSQMTRYRFSFEKQGQYRECPLAVYVDYDLSRETMQVYFSREGRELLQDWGWEWTLQRAPGNY